MTVQLRLRGCIRGVRLPLATRAHGHIGAGLEFGSRSSESAEEEDKAECEGERDERVVDVYVCGECKSAVQ